MFHSDSAEYAQCVARSAKALSKTIAANVASARRRAQLTQERLAEAAGIDVRTLQDLEAAKFSVLAWTLYSVAKALGLSMDELTAPTGRRRQTVRRPPERTP